jgi:hypothetical protein
MNINDARDRIRGLSGKPNPFRDRALSNPEGINQYTKGGVHGGRGEPSSIATQRFKSEHGTAVVSTAPHGTHSGSIRVRIVPHIKVPAYQEQPAYTTHGAELQYHSKDPKEALAIAKAFTDKGHAGLNEHFSKKYPVKESSGISTIDPISRVSTHDNSQKASEALSQAHDHLVAHGFTKGATRIDKQPESQWSAQVTTYHKGNQTANLTHSTSDKSSLEVVSSERNRKKAKQY